MNGPDHYREAERLLGIVGNPETEIPAIRGASVETTKVFLDLVVAQAQVHAVLAQTAATYDAAAMAVSGNAGFDWAKALL